jgi:16S rRNA (cytosine967-C5)-methyltransferase
VAGFVNAVLRRLAAALPSGAGGTAEEPAPGAQTASSTPVARLAAHHSHPAWLVERWLARFGEPATERLLAWNNTQPPLVLQPARWTLAELHAALDRAGVRWTAAAGDGGVAVTSRRPTELPGYADGGFFVQDPSQALVTRFFAPPARALIFDACAAPGGKSLTLGRTARLVVAADRQRGRVRRLAENLRRAGTGTIAVILADATRPPIRSADGVVLDVPCSGTGTLARNPDARWRITRAALASLVRQSAGFLDAAADVVAPGGLLLFATCSLEPEENELQTAAFLARDPRFRREPSSLAPPELLTPDGDLMILPHRHGMDGAFASRLRRVAV